MGKNYTALHYIQNQLSGYDKDLITAIQRLFNIEDQRHENQGCIIDSVVLALLLKKYGYMVDFHLGEVCTDGKQDAYHCWLTLNGQTIDIGIYGNSNYNPYFKGEKLAHPLILDDSQKYGLKYEDGTTDASAWLFDLSQVSITEYMKKCPNNRVVKLICKCLDISETIDNQNMIYELSQGMNFPKVEIIKFSPSGHSVECIEKRENDLEIADEKYIEKKCKEMDDYINFVERTCAVKLIGERANLESGRPYIDCVGKPQTFVDDFFLVWKEGISNRYKNLLKG